MYFMCNESWHIKINLVHDFEDEGEMGCVVRKFMAFIWWTINLKGIHWENEILRHISLFFFRFEDIKTAENRCFIRSLNSQILKHLLECEFSLQTHPKIYITQTVHRLVFLILFSIGKKKSIHARTYSVFLPKLAAQHLAYCTNNDNNYSYSDLLSSSSSAHS